VPSLDALSVRFETRGIDGINQLGDYQLKPGALLCYLQNFGAAQMKIEANGIGINVRDQGHGEPSLVFLHYWGGSSRTWRDVIARLPNYRSIAIDHRGWGESDAPADGYTIADLADDAQAVIAALKLQRYVIVGHSMGGKTAQLLASRRPAGLAGLVLVAPSPPSPTLPPNEQREALLHAYDTRESVAYVRDNILTARPLTEAQKARVIEDSLIGGPAAKLGWVTQAMPEDIRAEVARINVPTLVLSGDKDQVDPTARLREEVLPGISGSRLHVLAGVGHLAMLEAPDEVARAIEDFVGSEITSSRAIRTWSWS
jgi:pimeloyl-ACP methyl ester carboxylesterase